MAAIHPTTPSAATMPWRAVLAALAANLVGIGLARFAYTPLIPALIEARWFDAADVVYLGAANLAGYLAGALAARRLAAAAPAANVLRAMMVLATLSFFASAWPLSFAWYFLWRFAAGLAGGALMALAAPMALARVPAARRGLAGGVVFTGVGLGIAASGNLVPPLLELGLTATWLGLGLVALALTLAVWRAWPEDGQVPSRISARARGDVRLFGLYLAYGLNAVALVPHMVFLVDFVARGLDRGLAAGAEIWVVFGLGAMAGPILAGRLADRLGAGPALRLALLAQALAIAALAVSDSTAALILSSLVIGGFVPGVVPLALGRVQELLPDDPARQQAAWSRATAAFALGQAAGGYGLSFVFAASGAHIVLFELALAAALLALAVEAGIAAWPRPPRR